MVTPKDVVDDDPGDSLAPARPSGKDFGLVIGVDHYADLPRLAGARADARRFYKWMRRPRGGGVEKDHARLILSKPYPLTPLQHEIDVALADLMKRANAIGGGRRLYFHFSGHGAASLETKTQDVALLLAAWSQIFYKLALSSDGYREYVVNVGLFQEVAIFLDCCRTQTRVMGASPTFDVPRTAPPCDTKIFVAHATPHRKPAFEVGRDRDARGIFTDCLLAILRGARNPLTVTELRKKLRGEAKYRNQEAWVLTNFDEGSTFGHGGGAVRLVVSFRTVRDGRVSLYDDRLNRVAEHQVGPEPWVLELLPGAYSLEHGAAPVVRFDHGRDEVTHVRL
jgi:hypothetical protein